MSPGNLRLEASLDKEVSDRKQEGWSTAFCASSEHVSERSKERQKVLWQLTQWWLCQFAVLTATWISIADLLTQITCLSSKHFSDTRSMTLPKPSSGVERRFLPHVRAYTGARYCRACSSFGLFFCRNITMASPLQWMFLSTTTQTKRWKKLKFQVRYNFLLLLSLVT